MNPTRGQGPFSEYLNQPFVAPRNPAGAAGFGGAGESTVNAVAQFIEGASRARAERLSEAEYERGRNQQALLATIASLEQGPYDKSSTDYQLMRRDLANKLAEQFAGMEDGSAKGQPGNPVASFFRQLGTNALGGAAPKKVAPLTKEELQGFSEKIAKLPTVESVQKQAITDFAKVQAETVAKAKAAGGGIFRPESLFEYPEYVTAHENYVRVNGKQPPMPGLSDRAYDTERTLQAQEGLAGQYGKAMQAQRAGTELQGDADPMAQAMGLLLQQKGTQPLAVPLRVESTGKQWWINPTKPTDRMQVLLYPGQVATTSEGTPVDLAALRAQGMREYSTAPTYSPTAGKTRIQVTVKRQDGTVFPSWGYMDMANGGKITLAQGDGEVEVPHWAQILSYSPMDPVTGTVGAPVVIQGQPQLINKGGLNPAASAQGGQQQAPVQTQPPTRQAPPTPPKSLPSPQQQPQPQGATNPFRTQAAEPQMMPGQVKPLPTPGAGGPVKQAGTFLTQPDAAEAYAWRKSVEDLRATYGQGIGFANRQFNESFPGAIITNNANIKAMKGMKEAVNLFSTFDKLEAKYASGATPLEGDVDALRSAIEGRLSALRGVLTEAGAFTDRDRDFVAKLTPQYIREMVLSGRNEALASELREWMNQKFDTITGGNMTEDQKNFILKQYKLGPYLRRGTNAAPQVKLW